MGSGRVGVEIDAAHVAYERLIEPTLEEAGLLVSTGEARYVANVVLDYPLTWAFSRLERLNSIVRARTVVLTQASHPVYLDCIASYHVSGVVNSTDEPPILGGVYAAANAQKTHQWRSSLTYMELRVSRLLLQGEDTQAVARQLSISSKTVNAHVSNVLGKLGCDSRAQLVALILGATSEAGSARVAVE